jgi:Ca2+:H+ antiporter
MVTLAVTAVVTGVMSELLVSAIEPTIEQIGIGTVFIGMVVVPLVGNVPEHWAAVRIARGGNLDFSMSIAFNSGLQVALAGTAIAVFAGALLGHEVLIVFPPIELALLGAATIMTGILASMGRANWLEGLQLLAIYAIAALAFWFL